jgi:hypothetical protein
MYAISTEWLIETTQIWGKEFPGSMFSMMPGNSSFFVFSPLAGKNRSALPHSAFPNVHPCIEASRAAIPSGSGRWPRVRAAML